MMLFLKYTKISGGRILQNNIFTILKKELKRVFMDRKLAFAVFIMPGFTIAVIYSLMGGMIEQTGKDASEHIPITYVTNMPNEFQETALAMYGGGINIIEFEQSKLNENINKLEQGEIDVIIVFENDFIKKMDSSLPSVTKYTNSLKDNSIMAGYMVDSTLESFRQSILAQRLGDSERAIVFKTGQEDVAKAGEKAGQAISMLMPMLLTIFLFAGAMQVGVDTIAGEKERGTIATMLLTPVKRSHIAIGKMLSLAIISLVSCMSSLVGIIVSLPFSKSMFGGGFELSDLTYKIGDYLFLIVQMAVLAISFVAIICLMSSLAKNIKEAGSYIAPVYILVMMISISTMFAGDGGNWGYFMPIYGNILNIKDIFTLNYSHINGLFSIISALIFALLMSYIMVRIFYSERMMKS